MSLSKNGDQLPKCPNCGCVSTKVIKIIDESIETRTCFNCGKSFDSKKKTGDKNGFSA